MHILFGNRDWDIEGGLISPIFDEHQANCVWMNSDCLKNDSQTNRRESSDLEHYVVETS